ncbi:hypothetical protein SAMN05421780_103245 [Flexibacter flexilis DSM 6793]|uniref:Uncharacterized protein n=1 Tax=Flexibacter flexilis DSM 6793 TaxID=927664 RepID=A0A1I1HF00_9BACT|nr:hypothetical protein [Flexibacter flexilis]SFC20053.1 hypothetical protein SAMN05421780_103245 [Flexibacter flexilis DSM 6793]
MEHNFCFYIHDAFFDDIELRYIKDFRILTEIPRQLSADTYYNKTAFNQLFDLIKSEKYFPTSQEHYLINFKTDFKPLKSSLHLFDIVYNKEQSSITHFNIGISEENIIQNNIIILSPTLNEEKKVLVIKSDKEFWAIDIKISNSAEEVWKYIISKLPERIYHFHKKHGNNNTPAHSSNNGYKVSQLLASDIEAQSLLNSAIFDKREKEKFHYYFDKERNTYIIFPKDNVTQNTFHAFHITEAEHDKEVPASIRAYFDYLRKLK